MFGFLLACELANCFELSGFMLEELQPLIISVINDEIVIKDKERLMFLLGFILFYLFSLLYLKCVNVIYQ